MEAIAEPQISQSDFLEYQEFLEFKKLKDRGISIANLTRSNLQTLPFFGNLSLDVNHQEEGGLLTMGQIRTKEKCPECGGKFKDFERIMACESCLAKRKISIPKRYYIDIYYNKKYKLYSDNDGEVLDSYERAKRLLIEINQKIRKPNYVFNPSDYTAKDCRKLQFSKYAAKWIEQYEIKYKNDEISLSTITQIKRYVKNYYVPFFNDRDIREIFDGDIEDFYLKLPKLELSTKKGIMAWLHKIFNDAKRRREIKEVPIFPTIILEDSEPIWLDEETQDLIYQNIPDRHKPIFLFMMRQGVRPGECRALHWEDIDWKDRTANIHRTYYKQYLKNRTKARTNRTIPLDIDVCAVLSKMRGISGLVFTLHCRHYSDRHLNTVWDKAVVKTGLKHITLYSGTRHSVASQAINRGVTREQIGAFLGHVDYATTKKYLHMNTTGLKPVLRKAEVKKLRPQIEAQLRA